jgi:hypothetical protein
MNQLCRSSEQHSTLMATSSSSSGEHVINATLASPDGTSQLVELILAVSNTAPAKMHWFG